MPRDETGSSDRNVLLQRTANRLSHSLSFMRICSTTPALTPSRRSGQEFSRRAGRSAVVVVVAILAIGIAAVAIVHSLREEFKDRPFSIRLASGPLANTGAGASKDVFG